ncbi:uncharacterized protein LOC118646056 [Monomorium pharaonis]|uniref:uncharacterized protein LOC118646056 n=1 Tax=Monomorium pharaonis TaxID=307658 RepID=UPI0017470150|nr:uncharacterized protein LOC118646056 [Monomorium pharaonis]
MGKRAYTCLRNVFEDIPSIKTVQTALHKIPMSPGLNTFILRHLEKIAPNMSSKEKVCILMWDKISIQPKLTYNIRKDVIYGLEDWGNNRTNKVANHGLVFMLRGLNSGWKMPLSYNFCNKQTNTAQLIRCIKEHINKVNNAGFHIVATVCDQGSSNVAAIKELLSRINMKRDVEQRAQGQTFEVGNVEVISLFDFPHLIKGIRNNLLTKHLALNWKNPKVPPKEIASWDIIKTAWRMNRKMNVIRP